MLKHVLPAKGLPSTRKFTKVWSGFQPFKQLSLGFTVQTYTWARIYSASNATQVYWITAMLYR
jgi:hypothetical protein